MTRPGIFQSPDDQLVVINEEYDRVYGEYLRAICVADLGATEEARADADSDARSAVSAMKRLRIHAGHLAPTTILGFALKARLFTCSEPAEWLNIPDHRLITDLIGQLVAAAGLRPVVEIGESATARYCEELQHSFLAREDAHAPQ